MWLRLAVHVAVFIAVPNALGQLHYNPPNGVTTTQDGRVLVGPDPMIEQNLYGLLRSPAVRRELGMQEHEEQAYLEIFKRYGVSAPREIWEDPAAMAKFRSELSANILSAIREVVSPALETRLRALAYRYEVSAIGMAEALAYGRLGDAVGVHNNQQERILRVGKQIETRLDADIKKLRMEAELELMNAVLTPEQRKETQATLGAYFHHDDTSAVQQLYHRKLQELQAAQGSSRTGDRQKSP